MKWVARPGIPVLVLVGYKCICIFRLVEETSEVTAHHCFGGQKKRQSINEARKWWSTLLVSIYLPTLPNLEKEDQLLKFPVGSIIAIHKTHMPCTGTWIQQMLSSLCLGVEVSLFCWVRQKSRDSSMWHGKRFVNLFVAFYSRAMGANPRLPHRSQL